MFSLRFSYLRETHTNSRLTVDNHKHVTFFFVCVKPPRRPPQRQYLYFCTSKARNLSTFVNDAASLGGRAFRYGEDMKEPVRIFPEDYAHP